VNECNCRQFYSIQNKILNFGLNHHHRRYNTACLSRRHFRYKPIKDQNVRNVFAFFSFSRFLHFTEEKKQTLHRGQYKKKILVLVVSSMKKKIKIIENG
jgi:hypothetical protein